MEINSYAPGTPCWVDLAVPDPSTSSDFYAELFGWTVHDTGEQGGGYRLCRKRGRPVAGIGPLPPDAPGAGPRFWSTYIAVHDLDATADAVQQAGGAVRYEPVDVPEAGRMAVFGDPSGAEFCAWEAREHPGSMLVGEPGAPCWHELATREPERELVFYRSVFGWEGVERGTGYTTWNLAGREVGGMIRIGPDWPPEVPAHWMAYFSVADADGTVQLLRRLGGDVDVGPADIEPGRFAVVHDPAGAMFGIIAG